MHFTFGTPYFLLLLLLLPCFFWCSPPKAHYYFPKLDWLGRQSALWSIEPWLKVLIYTLMVLALAKPMLYDNTENHHRKGRDLILALDASGSMGESEFDTKNRYKRKYDVVLTLTKTFVHKRFDDNMGVVIFGTFAYSASPLTYDLSALRQLLEMTDVGIAGESTAIGDAIMQSLHTLRYGTAKRKAIILLTDGKHNAGSTSPKDAVRHAKKAGVKIYTIGIGKPGDYDAALLQKIATETGGKAFFATDAEALRSVYESIEQLEPSPIRSESYLNQRLLIAYPLWAALLLLAGWIRYYQRKRV
jgi:Ca-activated chloride channel family protein